MNDERDWYSLLQKPAWAPPDWLFSPVWTILYMIILITFGWVFYKAYKGEIPKSVTFPFILNLVFNILFTPLQFGLKSNLLAAIDILLVWITIVWFMKVIYKYNKYIAFANTPYLLWVSLATVLQFTITYLNW